MSAQAVQSTTNAESAAVIRVITRFRDVGTTLTLFRVPVERVRDDFGDPILPPNCRAMLASLVNSQLVCYNDVYVFCYIT